MEYNFVEIEQKWQKRWIERKTYKVEADPSRPKFYVLDMFPYPSGVKHVMLMLVELMQKM